LSRDDQLLLEAVQQHDLAAVQQQLAAGADTAAADENGITPLHLAAASGQGWVVATLLAAGADVSSRTRVKPGSWSSNVTPLQLLTMGMCYVPSSTNDHALHSQGQQASPVHHCGATCEQQADVVQQLAAAGAQVDVAAAGKDCKRTPLHFAAAAGCSAVVAALLQAGADPATSTPSGYNVLHAAASSGSLEVMQQVLGALGSSSDVAALANMLGQEALDKTRARPLHLAAAAGQFEVVEALLAAGADEEQPDDSGDIALHYAMRQGHYHLAALLVTPTTVNKQSEEFVNQHCSLLHWVAAHPQLGGTITSHPAGEGMSFLAAIRTVATLLAAGADTSVKNAEGLTALGVAAGAGPLVFRMFLQLQLATHQQQQQGQGQQQSAHHQQQQQQGQGQQQPPHQQQQKGDKQTVPHPLRDVAVMALCRGATHGPETWYHFVNVVADLLGEEHVQSLWGDVKQVLLHAAAWSGLAQGAQAALDQMIHHSLCVLNSWGVCWTVACQPAPITRRLEELGIPAHRHHHQQQQLTLPDQPSSSSAAGGQLGQLEAAAASGSEGEVRAALDQLPDRAAGLSAGAVAAGKAKHWGLCVALLRDLSMLDKAQGGQAMQALTNELSTLHVPEVEVLRALLIRALEDLQQQNLPSQPPSHGQVKHRVTRYVLCHFTPAVLPLCDALLADWLSLRQRQRWGLREAVVAAVEAAVAAAHE
jgi:ankyrin repeat protein